MSELLGSLFGGGGGGGDFSVRTITSAVRSIGSTIIVSAVPPSGQRVKLTHLEVSNSSAVEINVEVKFGSTVIFFGSIGHGGTPTNTSDEAALTVGSIPPPTATLSSRVAKRSLIGKVDETLTITKLAGTTTKEISYGYDTGE